MFIISLSYKKEISEAEKFMVAHGEFLDQCYAKNKFIFSGRKTPRTGGIILAHNVNKTELMQIIQQDPFYQNEIAEYEIIEFTPTKFDKNFSFFINK